MKITKAPHDHFGIPSMAISILFLIVMVTMLHNVSDTAYYLFLTTFFAIQLGQTLSRFYMKTSRKSQQKYHADTKGLYPNRLMENPFYLLAFIAVLIILRWKLPSSSEPLIWIFSIGGILFLFFEIRNYFNKSFELTEPVYQVFDSKKSLIFHQRGFSVEFEKKNIKRLLFDSTNKTVMVETDEKRVFKMPYHSRGSLELMRLDFSDQYPHWFIEN